MSKFALLIFSPKLRRAHCRIGSGDCARQGCRAQASMDGFTACHRNRYGNVRHYQQGFTLVEMVAVIVLLSFGLIAGSQLFRMTAESYRDTSTRTKLTQDGRFVVERISRELREALPNSVRESTQGATQCIEWVPIVAASRYLSLPTPTVPQFTVMELGSTLPTGTRLFAAVFPVSEQSIYQTASADYALRELASPALIANSDPSVDQIAVSNSTPFPSSSPSDRVFFTTTPVAICVRNNGDMVRLNNYGFVGQSANLTGGVLLAENLLQTGVDIFRVTDATLTRNAMVDLNLQIRDPRTEEVLRLQHTLFIRNVP